MARSDADSETVLDVQLGSQPIESSICSQNLQHGLPGYSLESRLLSQRSLRDRIGLVTGATWLEHWIARVKQQQGVSVSESAL